MPLRARMLYDNAVCHIIQRGNNKQELFRKEYDYVKFKLLMAKYKTVYEFDLYNYCLMPNHIHMLIKIKFALELPKLMQGLLQSFRLHYKREYGSEGHLYQGRYRSKLIEDDTYLLECARYIERNPVRAGISADLSSYRWSSFDHYARGRRDIIITDNPAYAALVGDPAQRMKIYVDYLSEPRTYEEMIDRIFAKSGSDMVKLGNK